MDLDAEHPHVFGPRAFLRYASAAKRFQTSPFRSTFSQLVWRSQSCCSHHILHLWTILELDSTIVQPSVGYQMFWKAEDVQILHQCVEASQRRRGPMASSQNTCNLKCSAKIDHLEQHDRRAVLHQPKNERPCPVHGWRSMVQARQLFVFVLAGVDSFHRLHTATNFEACTNASGHLVARKMSTSEWSLSAMSELCVEATDCNSRNSQCGVKTFSIWQPHLWVFLVVEIPPARFIHVRHLRHRLRRPRRPHSDRTRFPRRAPQIIPGDFQLGEQSEQFALTSPGEWRKEESRILLSGNLPCTFGGEQRPPRSAHSVTRLATDSLVVATLSLPRPPYQEALKSLPSRSSRMENNLLLDRNLLKF